MRNRPGALSPGGIGVDIKHNSYNRYLNRIKGQGPSRRGVIPPGYGSPIPFNLAFPIYGGKTVKTSIVGGCECPVVENNSAGHYIYGNIQNAIQDQIYNVTYQFNVGDTVWALKPPTYTTFYKATILSINGQSYLIQFTDDNSTLQTTISFLLIYYDCNCPPQTSLEEQVLNLETDGVGSEFLNAQGTLACSVLSSNFANQVF